MALHCVIAVAFISFLSLYYIILCPFYLRSVGITCVSTTSALNFGAFSILVKLQLIEQQLLYLFVLRIG